MRAKDAYKLAKSVPTSTKAVDKFVIAALELAIERSIKRGELWLSKVFQDSPNRETVLKHFEQLGYRVHANDARSPTFTLTWLPLKEFVKCPVYVNVSIIFEAGKTRGREHG